MDKIYKFKDHPWDKEHAEYHDRMKSDPGYMQALRKHRESQYREYWMTLTKPFKDADDVPELPKIDDFYINKLVDLGAIPKDKLEDDIWYYGNYRNSTLGLWSKKDNEFGLWRWKFGHRWDTCNHFEDDNGHALFVPLRKANVEEIEEMNKIDLKNDR